MFASCRVVLSFVLQANFKLRICLLSLSYIRFLSVIEKTILSTYFAFFHQKGSRETD